MPAIPTKLHAPLAGLAALLGAQSALLACRSSPSHEQAQDAIASSTPTAPDASPRFPDELPRHAFIGPHLVAKPVALDAGAGGTFRYLVLDRAGGGAWAPAIHGLDTAEEDPVAAFASTTNGLIAVLGGTRAGLARVFRQHGTKWEVERVLDTPMLVEEPPSP